VRENAPFASVVVEATVGPVARTVAAGTVAPAALRTVPERTTVVAGAVCAAAGATTRAVPRRAAAKALTHRWKKNKQNLLGERLAGALLRPGLDLRIP
jgi:hypothetical protein